MATNTQSQVEVVPVDKGTVTSVQQVKPVRKRKRVYSYKYCSHCGKNVSKSTYLHKKLKQSIVDSDSTSESDVDLPDGANQSLSPSFQLDESMSSDHEGTSYSV